MVTNVSTCMVTDHNNDKATRTKMTKWIGYKLITNDPMSILWLKASLGRHERRTREKEREKEKNLIYIYRYTPDDIIHIKRD